MKHEILKKHFGYTTFREGQEKIIDSILSKRDTLAVMPTGSGKSICFQVPAIIMDGITIVISPLISLMKDQVTSLKESGISAAYFNSTLTSEQYKKALMNAKEYKYKIIYVAPERLTLDSFKEFSKSVNISMITIDEVHCVSHWGQDFRPSYLKIVEYIKIFENRPIISAFTATATNEVKEDVISVIGLNNPFVLTTGYDRKNLFYSVMKPSNKLKKLTSLIDKFDKFDKLSGIVYCSTRKSVEDVYERLNSLGYSVSKYHAGLSKEERASNQEDFVYDKKLIMVATNAFGMGIDKSNVRFVIHYNMPKDIESYYQEAGRAGRDSLDSECVLFYSPKDVVTNEWFIENGSQNEDLSIEVREQIKEREKERLKKMIGYCFSNECLRSYILNYFGENSLNYCNKCSNCLTKFDSVNVTEECKKILNCILSSKERFGKTLIVDTLKGVSNKKITERELNYNEYYGSLKTLTNKKINDIVEYLIVNDYLIQVGAEYPILKISTKSKDVLEKNYEVIMKMVVGNEEEKEKLNDIDNYDLFEDLRKLRLEFASLEHMPPYIIFSDKTLKEMCKKKPVSKLSFLKLSGVGEYKYNKYGEAFIKVIWSHVKKEIMNKKQEMIDK